MQGAEIAMCHGIAPHRSSHLNAFPHSQMGSNLSSYGMIQATCDRTPPSRVLLRKDDLDKTRYLPSQVRSR